MKKTVLYVLLGAVIYACGDRNTPDGNQVSTIDLVAAKDKDVSNPLRVKSLTMTELDSDNPDAFFNNVVILDVVGDTLIMMQGDEFVKERIILFDLKSGTYMGQINHRGQGAGEYNVISGAFVDKNKQTVLLTDMGVPKANIYSLVADTLVRTQDMGDLMTFVVPTGSVDACLNFAHPTQEGLKIMQTDATFTLLDSIFIPDFKGGQFNKEWFNSDSKGMILLADTLCHVNTGVLDTIAILSRGKYGMSFEKEREIFMKAMDGGVSETELLKPYIVIRDIQVSDDKLLLTTMYEGDKYSDFYDLNTGTLLYRNKYKVSSKQNSVVLDDGYGNAILVEYLFAKDGTWYGLVENDDVNLNSKIVRFSLH